MRLAAKVDTNHKDVVKALRKEDCTVVSTAAMGRGFPDAVVGISGQTFLVEIKDGAKPPSARSLTSDQVDFICRWKGSPVVILTDCKIAQTWARRMKEMYGRDSSSPED
jgi:Holliday junction resolvase